MPSVGVGGSALCTRALQQGGGMESKPLAGSRVLEERLSMEEEEAGQLVWVNVIQSGYNRLFLPFIFGPLDLICS